MVQIIPVISVFTSVNATSAQCCQSVFALSDICDPLLQTREQITSTTVQVFQLYITSYQPRTWITQNRLYKIPKRPMDAAVFYNEQMT